MQVNEVVAPPEMLGLMNWGASVTPRAPKYPAEVNALGLKLAHDCPSFDPCNAIEALAKTPLTWKLARRQLSSGLGAPTYPLGTAAQLTVAWRP